MDRPSTSEELENLRFFIPTFPQIRCVVEEGLNQLPYKECEVTTPTGHCYKGVEFEQGNCGVSIMRSGRSTFLFILSSDNDQMLPKSIWALYAAQIILFPSR